MRRNLSTFARRPTFASSPATSFSTSSGGGSGRGRGSAFSNFLSFKDEDSAPVPDPLPPSPPPPTAGHGRGRGIPLNSPPFSSYIADSPAIGRGRGIGPITAPPPERKPVPGASSVDDCSPAAQISRVSARPLSSPDLPSGILDVLNGAGRGKPSKPPSASPKEENRHIRARTSQENNSSNRRPFVRDDVDGERGGRGRGRLLGRGRRRGRGRGRGRGREVGERKGQFDDADDDDIDSGLYLGDNADGEKLAQRLGPEIMDQLVEGFEEMSSRVLPSPLDDAYLDALHTNLLLECEPEYLMEEFGTNPGIEEKPPIPLRDALEKMKPFLMAYEGIQSQQEWEEVMEDLMKRVPLLKEIVDYYSGHDRVTAKQQQGELERVAKTLPLSSPASVKRFTDNAVLSLQSNPGWGFNKKCQLMDTIVREVSQNYK